MNWDIIQTLSSHIVFIMLLISVICYWVNLYIFNFKSKVSFSINAENTLFKIGKLSSSVAISLLVFILCSRWIVSGYFPLSNLYESLLFLTWVLLIMYLYMESKTKSKIIGATLIPLALLLNAFGNLTLSPEMQKASPLVPALQSNWLMLHVSMMLLSYGTLILGSLLCILFLTISYYQKVNLKKIEMNLNNDLKVIDSNINYLSEVASYYLSINDPLPQRLFIDSEKEYLELIDIDRLVLLENLDNWSYRILGLGFPFLTIGIISGGVWANEAWGSYWSWDPKETWALITWIVFATYLHARITNGWKGQKTAILGGLGFFVIWICYLGVNFLGKGLHSYGWFS